MNIADPAFESDSFHGKPLAHQVLEPHQVREFKGESRANEVDLYFSWAPVSLTFLKTSTDTGLRGNQHIGTSL